MSCKRLAELADDLFGKRSPILSLWQEISENFYLERADFTVTRSIGEDFGADMMSSYPMIVRRELGNQVGMMLRQVESPWFHMKRKFSDDTRDESNDVREHFEWFDETMRRAMYDPKAKFNRATKLADHDFATFGQACLSVEPNRNADGLLFRNWHLRDLAWQENAEGDVGFVVRKWKAPAYVLNDLFGDMLHKNIKDAATKSPFEKFEVYHIVCEAEMYQEEDPKGKPRWSIWWDNAHSQEITKFPIWGKHYIIPRWLISASQYAHSPATVAALPDGRLIQAMTYTMLQVSEKAADPPMLATMDAVKSDMSIFAGGVTWVDKDYDERLGQALRPLTQDFRGVPYGMEMTRDTRELLAQAFFLNKLSLPIRDPEMTAYEVGQRVQEYVRGALPIFEPMEPEYNGAMCEEVFGLMQRMGAFGSPMDWPKEMHGMDVDFRFESPLHDAMEKQKSQLWLEAQSLVESATAFDPTAQHIFDAKQALRDALDGVGVPAKWLRSETEVDEAVAADQQQQQAAQLLAALEQSSQVAANNASAQKDMAAAGVEPMGML